MRNLRAMDKNEKSGRIQLDGDVIRYRSSVYGDWNLPIQKVRIIGEYTNQDGPGADDWFLAFIVNADEMWYEASISAAGRDEFLSQIGSHLGVELTSELVYSTDFNSRVLWPADIAGTELFAFSRELSHGCANEPSPTHSVSHGVEFQGLPDSGPRRAIMVRVRQHLPMIGRFSSIGH